MNYRNKTVFIGLFLPLFFIWPGGLFAEQKNIKVKPETIYIQNCAVCHGDDGTGAMPGIPSLIDDRSWAKYPNSELVKRIQNGIQPAKSETGMPANAGNPALTENELLLSLVYLRSLTGSD